MGTRSTMALAAAFALGAALTQALHAQSKPPAYEVLEIDVADRDAYMKDYAPLAAKVIEDGGGRFLVRGGAVTPLAGAAPTGRVIITSFDNVEQAKAALSSPAYLAARKIGDKYAKFRSYIVEGVAK